MTRRRTFIVSVAAAVVLVATLAAAQGRRLLHEFFTYTDDDAVPVEGELGGIDAPGRIARGDAMLGDGPLTTPDGADMGEMPPGFADPLRNGPLRPGEDERLDDQTEREGMLHYVEVFDPAIAPFKRLVSRDEVNSADDVGLDIPLMRIADPTRTAVDVGGAAPPGWLHFRGEIRLDGQAGAAIPLPSPAPDGVITGAFTDPPIATRFERDGADNWFVVPATGGVTRLVWDVAVPPGYFGGPLPDGPSWDGTTTGRFFEEAPTVLREVGIAAGQSHGEIVRRLAGWFRGFAGGEFRQGVAGYPSLYLDIALGRVGVCRHRAIAFVVTAQAVGINARYVHNEAHAFAEVQLDGQWRRVDLGGDADGLDVVGGGEPLEAPADSLPSTPEFEAQQRRMQREARPSTRPNGAAQSDGSGSDNIGDGASPWEDPVADGSAFMDDGRLETRLEFSLTEDRAFRGEPVTVSGRLLTDDLEPIADRRVVFWIGPARRGLAGAALRAGEATTDRDGRFATSLRVPPTAPLGRGGIFAVFDGDSTYRASVSQ